MWEFSCEFTSRIKAGSPSTTQRLFPLKPRVLRGRVQYPGLKVAQPEASYTLQGQMQNSAFLSCFLKLLSHLNTIHTHCLSCERFGSLQC